MTKINLIDKEPGNKIYQTFFILIISLLILFTISIYDSKFTIDSFTIREIDLISDIRNDHTDSIDNRDTPLIVHHDIIASYRPTHSFKLETFSDEEQKILAEISDMRKYQITDFSANGNGLSRFINALEKAKQGKKKVRIAYFGDSIVEGDLLTQDLRYNLQKKFGGGGVGFVPMTSVVSKFRKTIYHDFSDNWKTLTFLKKRKNFPIGISGYTFIPNVPGKQNNKSWVRFKSTEIYPTTNEFTSLKIFYSHATKDAKLTLTIDNSKKIKVPLKEGKELKVFSYRANNPFKNTRISFSSRSPFYVYGANFDTNMGVQVDNFAFRSHTGINLLSLPFDLMKEFNKVQQYDLIILHYGVNVATWKSTSYSWYRKKLVHIIKYLQKCFPQADLLLVSAGDMNIKSQGKYITNPSIPKIVSAGAEAAEISGITFWNLFHRMGGKNSMKKWVDAKLANKDYTHFNRKGAKRVADYLTDALLEKYYENN